MVHFDILVNQKSSKLNTPKLRQTQGNKNPRLGLREHLYAGNPSIRLPKNTVSSRFFHPSNGCDLPSPNGGLLIWWGRFSSHCSVDLDNNMGMDQYLYKQFLGGWTSIYQLFWCSPGVQGFDTLPYDWIATDPVLGCTVYSVVFVSGSDTPRSPGLIFEPRDWMNLGLTICVYCIYTHIYRDIIYIYVYILYTL